MMEKKIPVIIIDLYIKRNSPAGSCVLQEILGLNEQFEIHAISNELEDSIKPKIHFINVTLPNLPLVLRYLLFYLKVRKIMKVKIKEFKISPIIQATQGQFSNCDISYPHFCHKAYLEMHWKSISTTGITKIIR